MNEDELFGFNQAPIDASMIARPPQELPEEPQQIRLPGTGYPRALLSAAPTPNLSPVQQRLQRAQESVDSADANKGWLARDIASGLGLPDDPEYNAQVFRNMAAPLTETAGAVGGALEESGLLEAAAVALDADVIAVKWALDELSDAYGIAAGDNASKAELLTLALAVGGGPAKKLFKEILEKARLKGFTIPNQPSANKTTRIHSQRENYADPSLQALSPVYGALGPMPGLSHLVEGSNRASDMAAKGFPVPVEHLGYRDPIPDNVPLNVSIDEGAGTVRATTQSEVVGTPQTVLQVVTPGGHASSFDVNKVPHSLMRQHNELLQKVSEEVPWERQLEEALKLKVVEHPAIKDMPGRTLVAQPGVEQEAFGSLLDVGVDPVATLGKQDIRSYWANAVYDAVARGGGDPGSIAENLAKTGDPVLKAFGEELLREGKFRLPEDPDIFEDVLGELNAFVAKGWSDASHNVGKPDLFSFDWSDPEQMRETLPRMDW